MASGQCQMQLLDDVNSASGWHHDTNASFGPMPMQIAGTPTHFVATPIQLPGMPMLLINRHSRKNGYNRQIQCKNRRVDQIIEILRTLHWDNKILCYYLSLTLPQYYLAEKDYHQKRTTCSPIQVRAYSKNTNQLITITGMLLIPQTVEALFRCSVCRYTVQADLERGRGGRIHCSTNHSFSSR